MPKDKSKSPPEPQIFPFAEGCSSSLTSSWMWGQLGRDCGRRIYPKSSMDNNTPHVVRTIPWKVK